MIDGHIHIERGNYETNWIDQFVASAMSKGIMEIWLLEHCYRFKEFVPMYDLILGYSDYIDSWFKRKAGVLGFNDYLNLVDNMRGREFPIKVRFGLEVCYFKEYEEFVRLKTEGKGLDFLVGSVHFVDRFAFDHKIEL